MCLLSLSLTQTQSNSKLTNFIYYLLTTKLRVGNVFTGVFCSQGWGRGRYPLHTYPTSPTYPYPPHLPTTTYLTSTYPHQSNLLPTSFLPPTYLPHPPIPTYPIPSIYLLLPTCPPYLCPLHILPECILV